jgi:hypothetical protein
MNEWDDKDFEWPGWPLKNNPHNSDFDLEARKRMIQGSELLLPFIYNYKQNLGKFLLEIGPFFNPLITTTNFPNKKICYWENDLYVLQWLKKNNENNQIMPIFCDLNKIEGDSFIKLKHETYQYFKDNKNKTNQFDSIVISQVLNYVDYKLFFVILKTFIKKDGLIFINNVIDYGLPKFFSTNRPKNNADILEALDELGYEVIEKEELETAYPDKQKNDRLILVVKNK